MIRHKIRYQHLRGFHSCHHGVIQRTWRALIFSTFFGVSILLDAWTSVLHIDLNPCSATHMDLGSLWWLVHLLPAHPARNYWAHVQTQSSATNKWDKILSSNCGVCVFIFNENIKYVNLFLFQWSLEALDRQRHNGPAYHHGAPEQQHQGLCVQVWATAFRCFSFTDATIWIGNWTVWMGSCIISKMSLMLLQRWHRWESAGHFQQILCQPAPAPSCCKMEAMVQQHSGAHHFPHMFTATRSKHISTK